MQKLSFDYFKYWHFDNSYLVVDLKFINAIYFKVGNFKSFDFTKRLFLNLKKLDTDKIKVEVIGFFQKQVFIIELNKEFHLNSKPFRTEIKKISPIEIIQQKTIIKIPNLWFSEIKPKVTNQNIDLYSKQIKINHKHFNIQDFI